MSSQDFAVFVGGAEHVLTTPNEATWQRVSLGDAADGTPRWSLYKQVTWRWPMLTDAEWAAIQSAIDTTGGIAFRTVNDAGAMVLCTGKADQYPAFARIRGVVTNPAISFSRVVES